MAKTWKRNTSAARCIRRGDEKKISLSDQLRAVGGVPWHGPGDLSGDRPALGGRLGQRRTKHSSGPRCSGRSDAAHATGGWRGSSRATGQGSNESAPIRKSSRGADPFRRPRAAGAAAAGQGLCGRLGIPRGMVEPGKRWRPRSRANCTRTRHRDRPRLPLDHPGIRIPACMVRLNFFRVFEWQGEPHPHEGQVFSWQLPGAVEGTPLLPANFRS